MDSPAISVRFCHIALVGEPAHREPWKSAWAGSREFPAGGLIELDAGASWTVPAGEACLLLECTSGAASCCGESVPGSLEIHSLVHLDPAIGSQLAPWVSSVARLLADRVSLRRLVDRFGERVRKETARSRMADLLEEANHRLQEQFVQDPLTGVPNRRRFEEHFDLCWGRAAGDGTGVGLILVDIDFFKKLNDSLGHQEGDRCLREVAQGMLRALARPNDIVARYGGEEFVVVMDQCEEKDVAAFAETVCQCVRDLAIPHPDHPAGHVTISAGATWTSPGLTSSAEDFLRTADEMLYQAKRTGRDRWILGSLSGSVTENVNSSLGSR